MAAIEILKNPKHVNNIRIQMLREDFDAVVRNYNAAKMHFSQKKMESVISVEKPTPSDTFSQKQK